MKIHRLSFYILDLKTAQFLGRYIHLWKRFLEGILGKEGESFMKMDFTCLIEFIKGCMAKDILALLFFDSSSSP